MTFKDIVTLAFNHSNVEAKALIKMLKVEKKKVQLFTSQIKKITFNEVFIACSQLILIALGLVIGLSGVYLSGDTLMSMSMIDGLRIIAVVGILIVSAAAVILSSISFKLVAYKIRLQFHDHLLVRAYTKKVKEHYIGLNNTILSHVEQVSGATPGLNSDLMYKEAEKYEEQINELTSGMLKGLVDVNSKKYLRFYIYDRSHITNPYTQVLYIYSSTLTIYSHFLHNSKNMKVKDLLDISIKSICINK